MIKETRIETKRIRRATTWFSVQTNVQGPML